MLVRSLLALGGFALGGTTAALMSPAAAPHAVTAAPVAKAVLPADRVGVPAASALQAERQGLILRPIATILAVPGRMQYGDYRWNEAGVPTGPVWVRVDLSSQIVSVFRGAHEIGTAVILYGADGLPTPIGKFSVLAKLKDHRSQTYDAPMPYTLRLTADGVSIHASNVRWGYATHGCVGVPEEFAAKLFDTVKVGDPVLIVGADASRKASA
jgi:lipoprotein-anchoring transpeptidase ErfK/SrfK